MEFETAPGEPETEGGVQVCVAALSGCKDRPTTLGQGSKGHKLMSEICEFRLSLLLDSRCVCTVGVGVASYTHTWTHLVTFMLLEAPGIFIL